VPIDKRVPVRQFKLATENYTEPLERFAFTRFPRNSVFVTVVATLITLLINSMAAYALPIYEFRGKNTAMLMVIGTLMIPITINSGAGLSAHHPSRAGELALGRDPSRRSDTDGRLPAQAVNADPAT
jgi:ABC-type Fe3+ transport system permease subunit